MKNYRVTSILAATFLLVTAVLASPYDDARDDCERKGICKLLIKTYDANPNKPATIGELLLAASQASTYGATLPTAVPVPNRSSGHLDDLVKDLQDSLRIVSRDFRAYKAGVYNRLDTLETKAFAGGSGQDSRVDGVVRTVGAHDRAIEDMDKAIVELREHATTQVSQTPRMIAGAAVVVTAIGLFAMNALAGQP